MKFVEDSWMAADIDPEVKTAIIALTPLISAWRWGEEGQYGLETGQDYLVCSQHDAGEALLFTSEPPAANKIGIGDTIRIEMDSPPLADSFINSCREHEGREPLSYYKLYREENHGCWGLLERHVPAHLLAMLLSCGSRPASLFNVVEKEGC